MINRVVLVGRLTKDPVLRKTANGASVTSFTLACTRRYKQEGQPDADFINTVAWNKTADIVQQYTHKAHWSVWKEEFRHAALMIRTVNVFM